MCLFCHDGGDQERVNCDLILQISRRMVVKQCTPQIVNAALKNYLAALRNMKKAEEKNDFDHEESLRTRMAEEAWNSSATHGAF